MLPLENTDDGHMCGIAGFYLLQQAADPHLLQRMCDAIVHRGPDQDGYHTDGGCGIGMRRLSIIDLSSGKQPIPNEDHSMWVVFNGEIYNFQQLRTELEASGHQFRTRSDTEVIIHLFESKGVEGFSQLRGMFAIAIWDARKRELILARDRFGKKPLYIAALPHGLYFGSELKCLLTASVPCDIDEEALRLYFQFNYIPDPWSPYKAIRKLEPGGWLRYGPSGHVSRGRYWKLPRPAETAPPGMTEDDAVARIRELFDESVKLRLVADVPLGAFLSGGIDSTSVVASMARQGVQPVRTFSIGFAEAAYNELPWAAEVARQYGTEHHEILVHPDSVNLVQRLVRHFDEPFGDSSAIPTFLVSEFAAKHVKVALTGDGGDELFAGYESFFAIDKLRGLDRIPQAFRSLLSTIATSLPYSAKGKNYLRMISRPNALERYFELNYSPHFLRQQLLLPPWMQSLDEPALRKTFSGALLESGSDILADALYFEATAKLSGDMLVKVDRASMACSLEVRSPLLDHELAEFAMRIPTAWKMRSGRGKDIFIRAVGDRLPPSLLSRPKKGFGVPLAEWFRGPMREFLWDHLQSQTFYQRGIVSPPFVEYLLTEHDRGRRDNHWWLWMLLMLEVWFRQRDGCSSR